MSDKKDDTSWSPAPYKAKEQNISEIMQASRADVSRSPVRVDIRGLLVQRTMARHGFTEKQALALILAFGG